MVARLREVSVVLALCLCTPPAAANPADDYHEPTYHEPNYHEPVYHEPPNHEPDYHEPGDAPLTSPRRRHRAARQAPASMPPLAPPDAERDGVISDQAISDGLLAYEQSRMARHLPASIGAPITGSVLGAGIPARRG